MPCCSTRILSPKMRYKLDRSLMTSNSPQYQKEIRERMFDDLAKLHERSFVKKNPAQVRALTAGAYVTHDAFSWSHDPYILGAFP